MVQAYTLICIEFIVNIMTMHDFGFVNTQQTKKSVKQGTGVHTMTWVTIHYKLGPAAFVIKLVHY